MKTTLHGYTLSEILIALAILGVCLAVAIPLLAQSRDKAVRNATFKELMVILYEPIRAGMLTDELKPENFGDYILDRVNATKTCRGIAPTGGSVQGGCWSATQGIAVPGNTEELEAGFVLPNGAQVIGLSNCCYGTGPVPVDSWGNGIVLDYNGPKGPNLIGQDILAVDLCYGPTCTPVVSGKLLPSWAPGVPPENRTLYNEIFK
jgi:prepilin-type N-terminal cleavage/methylation domain-containing protein